MRIQNYWDIADTIVVSDDPYRALADAIIIFAVTDYRDALFNCKDKRQPTSKEVQSIEKFFNSFWFTELTELDGEALMMRAKKEILDEYPEYIKKLKEENEYRITEIATFLANWTTERLTRRNCSKERFKAVKSVFRREMYRRCYRAIEGNNDGGINILNPFYVDKIMDSAMYYADINEKWFADLWEKQYSVAFDTYTVRLYDMNNLKEPPKSF